jgi:hypothetical protein
MLKRSPILIWTVWAAVFVVSICRAPARDLGQWEGVDPVHREWFNGLKRPDNPSLSCCGLADAYWADSYEVKDDQYIAIITDERDDKPLGRVHIENGKRFAVPNSKIKWDRGNPTGHGIVFIGHGLEIHCYLPPGEDRFSSLLRKFGRSNESKGNRSCCADRRTAVRTGSKAEDNQG